MIGKVTRMSTDNENGYMWGIVLDNEFIPCPRILDALKEYEGLKIVKRPVAGMEIEITLKG